jgi:hypothetical protein
MTGSKFLKIAFVTFALGLSLNANSSSESYRSVASVGPSDLNRREFQSEVAGRSLSQKDIIFRSLLSTEGKDLAWPSFPRTWHEESMTDLVTSNTRFGWSGGPVSGGISIDYKWGLKTSLVIVASNRTSESALDDHGVTVYPAETAPEFEIFKWDDATQRTLPNVRPDYPMVAFCAFEASLNYSVTAKGGVEFLGNGQSVENGRVHNISHTIFSRFIQVDGKMSPLEMLNRLCEQEFRPQVEQYANRDFSRTVAELQSHQNPENECQPSAEDGLSGDSACMAWFQRDIDRTLQKITVPRCVLDAKGVHRCELHAKRGVSCAMFWNKRGKNYLSGDSPILRLLRGTGGITAAGLVKVTDSPYEFDCDTASGLTCRLNRAPTLLFGVPIWHGQARCR